MAKTTTGKPARRARQAGATSRRTQRAAGHRELMAGLQHDLAQEWAAIISYRTYASLVQGPWRNELRAFFESEIPDELLHAQMLADKIVALGGIPTTVPGTVRATEEPREMLAYALADEKDTIRRYVERRRQAEACGEHGLAIDMDELISDESKHRDEIEMFLRRWPK